MALDNLNLIIMATTEEKTEKLLPTEQQMKEAMDAFEKACQQLTDLGCELKPGIKTDWGSGYPWNTDKTMCVTMWISIMQPIGEGQYRERRSYGKVFCSPPR